MITVTLGLGESLLVGPDVKVTVLAVRGGEVRLGIEAPQEDDIRRLEVWDAIQQACREKEAKEKIRAKTAAQSLPAPVEAPTEPEDAPGQAGRPPEGG